MNNNAVNTSTLILNGEQPKRELSVIQAQTEQLRLKMIEAGKAASSPEGEKAFKKAQQQYAQSAKEAKAYEKANWDIKKVLDDLSGSTMRDLIKAQKQLTAEMNSGKIERGTESWKQHQEQLKALKAEISSVNNETKVGQSGFMKFAEWTNKTWQLFAVGAMAITGVITVLKKYMDMRNELEDQNANLKAMSGLDDKSIEQLQKYAEKMASNPIEGTAVRLRESVTGIMEAYKLVGDAMPQLLKSPELLNEVTKQSMILASAAGMPLKDAVEGTVGALNQYSESADKAGRYVNALAAGSKFGAVEVPYITEALIKFGALAKDANIPIEQTVAIIETLGQKGFQAEVAGTGMKTMLVKMMAGAKETNPAIVGMSKALDNLNEKFSGPGGFNKMVDMFGEREVVIARSLIASRNQFNSLTKAVTGTNTAIDQAETQSQTVNAKIAQATNQLNILAMQLIGGISPAVLKAANMTNVFLRALVQLPAWLKENAGLLWTLTGVMISYTIAVNLQTIATKASNVQTFIGNTITKAGVIIDYAAAAAKALLTGNIGRAKAAMRLLNAEMLLNPWVALGAIIAVVTVAFYKLATGVTAAEKAWREYKINSELEIQTADQLFEAVRKTTAGTLERKKYIDQINSKYGEYLTNQLNEKSNLDDIAAAQEDVNQKIREKIAIETRDKAKKNLMVDDSGKAVGNFKKMNEATAGLDKAYTKSFGEDVGKIMKEEFYKKMNEYPTAILSTGIEEEHRLWAKYGYKAQDIIRYINDYIRFKQALNDEMKEVDNQFEIFTGGYDPAKSSITGEAVVVGHKKKIDNQIYNNPDETYKKAMEAVDIQMAKDNAKWKERHLKGLDDEETYQTNLVNVIRAGLVKKMELSTGKEKEMLEFKNQIDDIDLKRQDDAEKASLKAMIALNDGRLNAVVLYNTAQIEELNNQLEEGSITQSEYNNEILALDKITAEARIYAVTENGKDIAKFEYKSAEERVAAIEASNKEIEKATKDLNDAEKKIYHQTAKDKKEIDREIAEIEKNLGISDRQTKQKQYATELADLKTKFAKAMELAEDDAVKQKKLKEQLAKDEARIKIKSAEDTAADILQVANKAGELSSKIQETETMAVDNKYAKQLAAAKQAGQDTTALEAQIEEEKKAIKKKYADLDFAITAGKIIAGTAEAIIKAAPNVPLQILTGALGLAELAVANEQRQAIANLWTGGFTTPGDKYAPRGVVHAGEFVANQQAVNHSPMRKVFNLVDHAQRTNSVARITDDDIIRSLSVRAGYANGGFVPNTPISETQSVNVDMSAVIATMQQTNAVNAALLAQIQNGITANVSVSGNSGIAKATADYNKLINNANR